jgi:hypothetical protein
MGWVLAGVQSGCVATVGAEKKCPISFPAAISTSASFNKTLVRITHNNIIHSVAIMYVYALARAFAGSCCHHSVEVLLAVHRRLPGAITLKYNILMMIIHDVQYLMSLVCNIYATVVVDKQYKVAFLK